MNKPNHKNIGTDRYELRVFVVREKYADGRPKDLTIVYPEQMVKLSQDGSENEFITGYIYVGPAS